ncbi:MAG: hypothetical protein RIR18_2102 [Pseudomonadota bacterium]|jgi:hypothetical protein
MDSAKERAYQRGELVTKREAYQLLAVRVLARV